MAKIINWHVARRRKGLDAASFHPKSGISMRRANLQVQNGKAMKPKKILLRNGSEIIVKGSNSPMNSHRDIHGNIFDEVDYINRSWYPFDFELPPRTDEIYEDGKTKGISMFTLDDNEPDN